MRWCTRPKSAACPRAAKTMRSRWRTDIGACAGAGAPHWLDGGGLKESYRNGPEDWVAVLKPITKKSFLVTRPDTAIDMFLRAYQTALSGRPGPRVRQIPFALP